MSTSTMYLDTVSIFSHKVKIDSTVLKSEKWRSIPNTQLPHLAHWRKDIPTSNGSTMICLKYFPNINHKSLLIIQFNVRKLLNNSNNNSDPVILPSKCVLYDLIFQLIAQSVGPKLIISDLAQFKVRRADVAHNHLVSEYKLNSQLKMLDTLILPRFNKYSVGTSRYYNSSKTKFANSGVVIKFYNKTDEMLSQKFPDDQAFSNLIDVDHEQLLQIVDDGYLVVQVNAVKHYKLRFEGAFKVAKLNVAFKNHGLSNVLDNLLDESIQLALLNEYILKLHLDVPFYSKKQLHKEMDRLFPGKSLNKKMKAIADAFTNDKQKDLVRLINSTNPEQWLRKKVNILYDDGNGCHLAYAPQVTFAPIALPSISVGVPVASVQHPSMPVVKPQVSDSILNAKEKAVD